jgi:predicted Zn finger-like uncharacterized protein
VKLQCPGCQVSFTIPDEKIPQGKGIRILCPKCRIPISLKEHRGRHSEEAHFDQLFSPGIEDFSLLDDKSLLDVVEDGVKTALVCVSAGRIELIDSALRELDYFTVSASKGPYAVAKVQNNHYDVIVFEEGSDAGNGDQDLLLHHLQLLPMHTRREFFLCLLTEELPTLDHMSAFRKGVNMILNIRDLDKAKILLARVLKEHHIFYKTFRDELTRKGQL